MFSKLLVPLDGSALAERALAPALTIARSGKINEGIAGDVTLLRVPATDRMLVPDAAVLTGYGIMWPDQSLEQSRQETRDYLAAVCKDHASPHVRLHTQLLEGSVAETILEAATNIQADLIVMSSHGYSGLSRWLLSSVAERVLHSASCPVLIIRSPEPPRHVLIPLDGSALSERALEPGVELAARLGGTVTLLRAVPMLETSLFERAEKIEPGMGRRMEQDLHAEAENYLRDLSAVHARSGLTINQSVTHTPAADSILHYAETHPVDVIAMSTHGRTGLRRWVYGSVTEKVLRGATYSMLVIRPATI